MNDGWIPDWENFNEDKFYIAYYYYYDWFSHHRFNLVDILSTLPCIKSGKIAQQIIKDYEEELKIIFEIE